MFSYRCGVSGTAQTSASPSLSFFSSCSASLTGSNLGGGSMLLLTPFPTPVPLTRLTSCVSRIGEFGTLCDTSGFAKGIEPVLLQIGS